MSSQPGEPSEEEMRAALEEEMKRVHVQDVLLQSVVSLVNLGARRAGLAPGTEGEKDLEQTRLAIDAVRAVLPLLEQRAPEQVSAIRDAVSQLQMAYVRAGGTPSGGGGDEGGGEGGGEPPPERPGPQPQQPPPASGRLWVPGQ